MRNPYSKFIGTTSQYKYLHTLVNKRFGKPQQCEDCKSTTAKRYDWANLGNNYGYPYVIDRKDWRRLCRSCHQKQDSDMFIGKRFAGKTHRTESKVKTSTTMKKYWAAHPEQYRELQRKGVETRMRNKRLRNAII